MTFTPRVSVIIAAYHSDAVIAGCLKALRTQTFRDFEAIVVNSSPGDRTREIVTGEFPEVKFLEHPTRLLPHAARNRGVQVASGQLLVFTDADCRGVSDWLERLVKGHEAGHHVLCGAIEPEGSSWFELGVHLCKYSFRLSSLREGPRAIAGTANACYSRKVWDAVGPFDGDQFAGDGLLSWRAARHGWQPWFEPRAMVLHVFHPSASAFWRERRERGADFAYARTTFEQWSPSRLAAYLLAFPLLPILQLARGGGDAFKCG
ncbi:MAG: glycosyltransferase, partial [Deltaproteobacteria bacterium]|nr:glycosyltransferase [Deltaproteobacteria bacterium]